MKKVPHLRRQSQYDNRVIINAVIKTYAFTNNGSLCTIILGICMSIQTTKRSKKYIRNIPLIYDTIGIARGGPA